MALDFLALTDDPTWGYTNKGIDFDKLYAADSDYSLALNWLLSNQESQAAKDLLAAINAGKFGSLNGTVIDWSNDPKKGFSYLAKDKKYGPVHKAIMQFIDENDTNYGWKKYYPDAKPWAVSDKPEDPELVVPTPTGGGNGGLTDEQLALINKAIDSKLGSNWGQTGNVTNPKDTKELPIWMRKVPLAVSGLQMLDPSMYKADYSNYRWLENSRIPERTTSWEFSPTYQSPYLIDRNYALSPLYAQDAATRRQIASMSGTAPSSLAAMVANGYQMRNAAGQYLTAAAQQNFKNRLQANAANNALKYQNASGRYTSSSANASLGATADQLRLNRNNAIAAGRESIDSSLATARSGALTNFATNFGNLGKENLNYNMANSNQNLLFNSGKNGIAYYTNPYAANPIQAITVPQTAAAAAAAESDADESGEAAITGALGGKLKKKKRQAKTGLKKY